MYFSSIIILIFPEYLFLFTSDPVSMRCGWRHKLRNMARSYQLYFPNGVNNSSKRSVEVLVIVCASVVTLRSKSMTIGGDAHSPLVSSLMHRPGARTRVPATPLPSTVHRQNACTFGIIFKEKGARSILIWVTSSS